MSTALRPGDVVTYTPENRWCHDGWAIAHHTAAGETVLLDTYWMSGLHAADGHPVHLDAYQVEFNLNDYREIKYGQEWSRYAEVDRWALPMHSGYKTRLLVRRGAEPDLATQIENARDAVREKEHDVRWAQRSLELAYAELAELEAKAVTR